MGGIGGISVGRGDVRWGIELEGAIDGGWMGHGAGTPARRRWNHHCCARNSAESSVMPILAIDRIKMGMSELVNATGKDMYELISS